MKNNQFTGALMFLLLISTLASAFLIFKWNNYIHRQAEGALRATELNRDLATMNQLLSETAEYAKATGNKDINAIVQQFTTAPRSAASPAPVKTGK